MTDRPRLLLTNDDGIDSVGLHVLARAMTELGDVTIIAPDEEYSGAGAAIGALWAMTPEVHEARVDGIDAAWSVSGPPALCVMFARLGAFGPLPDLIVSGINPGANVARSVYHSGTVGAALTGRNGGISGVAISQSVTDFGVEGQGWEEMLQEQKWESAADVARTVVAAVLDDPPPVASVLNVNIPNEPVEAMKGYRWTEVGHSPPRTMATAALEPKPGHEGSYRVSMSFGDEEPQPEGTDAAAVMDGYVSLTWLSKLTALDPPTATPPIEAGLDKLIG